MVIRTVEYNGDGNIRSETWPHQHCPIINGAPTSPLNCMFCDTGHVTECHWPESCEEANCYHYQQEETMVQHILGLQDSSGDY